MSGNWSRAQGQPVAVDVNTNVRHDRSLYVTRGGDLMQSVSTFISTTNVLGSIRYLRHTRPPRGAIDLTS